MASLALGNEYGHVFHVISGWHLTCRDCVGDGTVLGTGRITQVLDGSILVGGPEGVVVADVLLEVRAEQVAADRSLGAAVLEGVNDLAPPLDEEVLGLVFGEVLMQVPEALGEEGAAPGFVRLHLESGQTGPGSGEGVGLVLLRVLLVDDFGEDIVEDVVDSGERARWIGTLELGQGWGFEVGPLAHVVQLKGIVLLRGVGWWPPLIGLLRVDQLLAKVVQIRLVEVDGLFLG